LPRPEDELRGADDDISRSAASLVVRHLDPRGLEPGPPFLQSVEHDRTTHAMREYETRVDTMKAHRKNSS
jgi:hypothetical protein